MRQSCSFKIVLSLTAVAVLTVGGCESVPIADSHFWKGLPDAGATPMTVDGTGGAPINPDGTGGAGLGPVTGSGGDGGTGGASSSGGMGASGGAHGSGGLGTGGGGRTGTGGSKGSGGASGTGGSSSGTGGSSTVGPGTLMVAVTTKSLGGQYEPRNVGAIWIADGNARFVKTLMVWGTQRRGELKAWGTASGKNLVDAITSATKSGHPALTATWDGTDISKALVPDGSYKVCFELADGKTQSQCVDFIKSRTAQTLMPPDTTAFIMRSLGYTP